MSKIKQRNGINKALQETKNKDLYGVPSATVEGTMHKLVEQHNEQVGLKKRVDDMEAMLKSRPF